MASLSKEQQAELAKKANGVPAVMALCKAGTIDDDVAETRIAELLASGKSGDDKPKKKTPPPAGVTKSGWLKEAKEIVVDVQGQTYLLSPRKFSSGSIGYYLTGKQQIGGQSFQVGCNVTMVASKELPE